VCLATVGDWGLGILVSVTESYHTLYHPTTSASCSSTRRGLWMRQQGKYQALRSNAGPECGYGSGGFATTNEIAPSYAHWSIASLYSSHDDGALQLTGNVSLIRVKRSPIEGVGSRRQICAQISNSDL
jgi:hypothetical protein